MSLFREVAIDKRLKIFCFLICLVVVQSCSGSEVGKRLSESFESPLKSESIKQNLNTKKTKDSNFPQDKPKLLDSKDKTISNIYSCIMFLHYF